MKMIIPCCGRSTRFPNLRPKWMLNAANGDLMVKAAVSHLSVPAADTIIAILAETEKKYRISAGLRAAFGDDLHICILDQPTGSQAETVYRVLEQCRITDSFVVKDSDNCFGASLPVDENFVCYDSLQNHTQINASNKSYLLLNQDQLITKIIEKKVVSENFSVGGYGFTDPDHFFFSYKRLSQSYPDAPELYLSHLINDMIGRGDVFRSIPVTNYEDWGTLDDWQRAKARHKTYFVDLDGVVFENSAQFFPPYWGETAPIGENVQALLTLERTGNKLVFTTSRTEAYRQKTTEALVALGFAPPTLVMGCMNGQRVLINDYSDSNPYPSAVALNLPRNASGLAKLLRH